VDVQQNEIITVADEIERADREYRKFPSFREWLETRVDEDRWKRYVVPFREQSEELRDKGDLLDRALEAAKRAAAVETGVIEKLYVEDRGLTFTAAAGAACFEAALDERPEETRNLIRSQLEAYDLCARSGHQGAACNRGLDPRAA
jgi:hypothetical protein